MKISPQNFVAFSDYMNFIKLTPPNVRVENNFVCKTKLAKCVKSALKTYIGRRYHLELELQRLLYTVHIDRILSVKNARAWVTMDFK